MNFAQIATLGLEYDTSLFVVVPVFSHKKFQKTKQPINIWKSNERKETEKKNDLFFQKSSTFEFRGKK